MQYTNDLRTPITHVGRVVQNARIDDDEYRGRTDNRRKEQNPRQGDHVVAEWIGDQVAGNAELMHISRFTPLLKNKTDSVISHWNGDSDLRVFDNTNAMSHMIHKSKLAPEESLAENDKDKLWSRVALVEMYHVEFAGVAATDGEQVGHSGGNMGGEARELVSQLGGLTTILNTGEEPIRAGAHVVWYLPRRYSKGGNLTQRKDTDVGMRRKNGLPMGKQFVGVRGLDEELQDQQYIQFCDRAAKMGSQVNVCLNRRMHAYDKVIGRALSAAKPGNPFDILLGKYSC